MDLAIGNARVQFPNCVNYYRFLCSSNFFPNLQLGLEWWCKEKKNAYY